MKKNEEEKKENEKGKNGKKGKKYCVYCYDSFDFGSPEFLVSSCKTKQAAQKAFKAHHNKEMLRCEIRYE